MAEKEVLIIEDDPHWQNDLKEILENAGYQVRIAESYDKAVEVLKWRTAQVAVVDLSLLPRDAENRQGRDIMKLAKIPTVCISGYVTSPSEASDIISQGLAGRFFDKREFENKKEQFLQEVAIALAKSKAENRAKWLAIERRFRRGKELPHIGHYELPLSPPNKPNSSGLSISAETLPEDGTSQFQETKVLNIKEFPPEFVEEGYVRRTELENLLKVQEEKILSGVTSKLTQLEENRLRDKGKESITQDNVIPAIKASREGNYEPLREYFLADYQKTSLYVARAFVVDPTLNIKRDTKPGGILDEINKVLAGHPEEEAAKGYLAEMLAKVRPRTPIGVIEHATDIATYAITALFSLSESYATKASDYITNKLFDQRRERRYKKILST